MLTSLLSLLILTVLIGGLWLWLRALQGFLEGKPLLPYEPRRPAPWDLLDLMMMLFLGVLCQLVAAQIVRMVGPAAELLSQPDRPPEEEWNAAARAAVIFAGSAANLLAMALSILVIQLRTGAKWRDLGVVGSKFLGDLKLGVLAFAMLAPPVYMIQLVLVQWVESKHPLIELLKEEPDLRLFALTGFSAVIVAPLTEEYLFRLLLQGWLEKLSFFRFRDGWISTRRDFARPWPQDADLGGEPSASRDGQYTAFRDGGKDALREDDAAAWRDAESEEAGQASSRSDVDDAKSAYAEEEALHGRQAKDRFGFWPSLVSATVFALLHYSHGPDWVPLLVFGLGLGYLYWRTHRIVACILVHFLLNSLTMLALLAEILGETP